MAHIMLNNNCNLNCPYCFASEYVNKNGVRNITIEDFETALTFVKTDIKADTIGFIGGEPLLHPNFKELLNKTIKDSRIKKIIIFTNGILLDKYILDILHPKVSLLINVNSPEVMGQTNYNKMCDNLDKLYNSYKIEKNITLGLNLYEECSDYSYIEDIIKLTKAKRLRTSITVPNSLSKRNINHIEYFKKMVPIATNLFKKVFELGTVPFLDCNYILPCTVSEEDFEILSNIENLSRNKEGLLSTNILKKPNCSPVIDINYDLKAVRCFGLSNVGEVPIYWFKDIVDLNLYFENQFDSLAFNTLTSEDCRHCEFRLLKKCMGGCLAYKENKIIKAIDILNSI